MKEYESLSHTRWDCKYRVMFIPKRRKRKIFEGLRRHLGVIFHERAAHEEATDRGEASDAGSCAHVPECAAEIRGLERGGLPQGQERDPDRASLEVGSDFTGEVL